MLLSSGFVVSDERVGHKTSALVQELSPENPHHKPTTSSVEKAFTPITRWVEDIFQNTSIMKPSAFNRVPANGIQTQVSLREAIKLALKMNSGTVLSANKINQDGQVNYKIKILSKDGVVNILSINAQGNSE